MKVAAALALAELAREGVPDDGARRLRRRQLKFGPEYIIPKPVDPRVLSRVAPAVAKAAMDSGAPRSSSTWTRTARSFAQAQPYAAGDVRRSRASPAGDPRRVVFPEGEDDKILRAAEIVV